MTVAPHQVRAEIKEVTNMRIFSSPSAQDIPELSEFGPDTTDMLAVAAHREISDEELACYSQLAPELAPVFEAIISNHDQPRAPEESYPGTGAIRC